MGAWGAGTFDNDTACDWVADLEQALDLSAVVGALNAVVAVGDDYLELDPACEALAACEVIALLKGNVGGKYRYPEEVDGWVKAHPVKPSDELTRAALEAIDRILAPSSELLELWDEQDGSEWRSAVSDLRSRIA
jgi:hypothetical protein